MTMSPRMSLRVRPGVLADYPDILSPAALEALEVLAPFNGERLRLMGARMERRRTRFRDHTPVDFLSAAAPIPGTDLTAHLARAGDFEGSPIPEDLQRQWVQGTGPAARPRASVEACLRNTAYALLSGADGWMFDGEDALVHCPSSQFSNSVRPFDSPFTGKVRHEPAPVLFESPAFI